MKCRLINNYDVNNGVAISTHMTTSLDLDIRIIKSKFKKISDPSVKSILASKSFIFEFTTIVQTHGI